MMRDEDGVPLKDCHVPVIVAQSAESGKRKPTEALRDSAPLENMEVRDEP